MAEGRELDVTEGGRGMDEPARPTPSDVDPSRAALVGEWQERVKSAKKRFEPAFERMRKCQQLAFAGGDKDWIDGKNYVAPILNRHIGLAVAQLYAKNPKAVVNRKKKLLFRLWDGTSESAQAAYMAAQPRQQATSLIDPATGQPAVMEVPGDPNAAAIVQEIMQAREQLELYDKLGKTMEILFAYFMGEQAQSYKAQLKKTVRKTKVNAVGYVKLDFQRLLEERPDIAAEIDDVTSKISAAEEMMQRMADGEIFDGDADIEALRLTLRDLQDQRMMVVREGPVLAFPKSTQIIVDPACTHLKTFAGANWIAIEYDMTPERIRQVYKIDVKESFTAHAKADDAKKTAKVWEVWDRRNRQVTTICDGHADFLREPTTPSVQIDRFFTVYPLVFNEAEHDDELYPLSDVWLARDAQDEYNRSREGLREHRVASRPWYMSAKGLLEENDKKRIGNHAAHELVELNIPPNEFDASRLVQRAPVIPIDPNQYEVNPVFQDILRVVGSQEANLGGTSKTTATESSIAESSRNASFSDSVDDLDEFLSDIAHGMGQLMLAELSVETVQEIVGPGAVWPEHPMSRDAIAKDLTLDIRAGSSGRPNRAAELANLERGMPFILQMPGINPTPVARKYLGLLDIDADETILEGLPSITALNAMSNAPTNPGGMQTGDPATNPASQGAAGRQNTPATDVRPGGPQPAYPAPMSG